MEKKEAVRMNLVLSLILLFSVLVLFYYLIIISPEKNEFELSIYFQYPLIFWIMLIVFFLISLIMILVNMKNLFIQKMCVSLFFIITITFFMMPYIRGYFIYGRFDPFVHIGFIKDILFTGHFGSNNFYPIMHILDTELYLIAGIKLEILTFITPLFFSFLFVIWFYIFLKEILEDYKKYLILLLPLSFLVFGSNQMVPNFFSFCMIPLILFIWYKNDIELWKKNLLVILLLINIIFFHPLTTLYLILMFIIFDITLLIRKKVLKNHQEKSKKINYFSNLSRLAFVSVIYFSWYFSFVDFKTNFRGVLTSIYQIIFASGYTNEVFANDVKIANRYMLSYLDLSKMIIFQYGTIILISFIAFLVLIYILYTDKSLIIKKRFLGFHYFGLCIFSFLAIIGIFIHFVGYERILIYILFLSFPILIVMISFLERNPKKILVNILLIVVIFMLIFTSIFSYYPSNLKGNNGDQVLKSEYAGISWFFENRDDNLKTYEQKISYYRFYGAIYSNSKITLAKNLGDLDLMDIPDHYNYNNYSYVGQSYKENVYFLISELGKKYIQDILPNKKELWRWTPEDLIRLNGDNTSNKIYTSRGLEIFLINAKGG